MKKLTWSIVFLSLLTASLYTYNRLITMADGIIMNFQRRALLMTMELICSCVLSLFLYIQTMKLILSSKYITKSSRRNQLIRRGYQIWTILDVAVGAIIFYFLFELQVQTDDSCPLVLVERPERIIVRNYIGASLLCCLVASTFMITMTTCLVKGAEWCNITCSSDDKSGCFPHLCGNSSNVSGDHKDKSPSPTNATDSVSFLRPSSPSAPSSASSASSSPSSQPHRSQESTDKTFCTRWINKTPFDSPTAMATLGVILFSAFLLYYNIQFYSLLQLHSMILDCQDNILDEFAGVKLAISSGAFMTNSFLALLLFITALSVLLLEPRHESK